MTNIAFFNYNWEVSIKINQLLNKAHILSLIKIFKIKDITNFLMTDSGKYIIMASDM
ncbi:hypothetical protein VTN02DRAFT_6161 [Thermoascus thermophilus]